MRLCSGKHKAKAVKQAKAVIYNDSKILKEI
jgi:hypothetical protein